MSNLVYQQSITNSPDHCLIAFGFNISNIALIVAAVVLYLVAKTMLFSSIRTNGSLKESQYG